MAFSVTHTIRGRQRLAWQRNSMDFCGFFDVVGMNHFEKFFVFDLGDGVFENTLECGGCENDAPVRLVQYHDVRCFLGHRPVGAVRLLAILICNVPVVFDRHDTPRLSQLARVGIRLV